MGSQTARIFTQFPVTILHDFSRRRRKLCSSIRSRRDWEREVKQGPQNQRFRFDDGSDEDDGFGCRNAPSKRIWWYDDGDDDDDGDSEYDVDEGFGIREASIGINLFSEVFRAFGWMIPAIAMSLLMGREHNDSTTVMALAVPLAQTAVSLLYDAIWGRQSDSLWPKSKKKKTKKKKKRPFARTRYRRRVRTEKEVGDYMSWVDSYNCTAENEERNFGGWDELEIEPRTRARVEKRDRSVKEDTPPSSD